MLTQQCRGEPFTAAAWGGAPAITSLGRGGGAAPMDKRTQGHPNLGALVSLGLSNPRPHDCQSCASQLSYGRAGRTGDGYGTRK